MPGPSRTVTSNRNSDATDVALTLVGMGEVTEPGPPQSDASDARGAATLVGGALHEHATAMDDGSAEEAEALLHDLARAPLAPTGIPETAGHTAAAYAVSARQPPRAGREPTLRPAVMVNLTQPLPVPVPEPRLQVPTPDESRHAKTLPGILPVSPEGIAVARFRAEARARRDQATRTRRTVLLGIVGVVGGATAIAIAILVFAPRLRSRPGVSPLATSELTALAADSVAAPTVIATTTALSPSPQPAEPVVERTPESAAPIAPAPPRPPSPPAAAAAPRPSARSASSSRPPPRVAAPKPTGTFEEPDRNF